MLQVLLVLLLVFPSKLDAACPAGWAVLQNNCYKKFNTPASWEDARSSCKGENGDLADVKDIAENTFVTDRFGGGNWLGITGCRKKDICNAVEFSTITWNNFATGQPNNEPQTAAGLLNYQFAVLKRADGKWEDRPKTEKHSYICKKSDDPCANLNCDRNGGICDGVNRVCKCNPGFSGKRCDIAPCDTDPCENGGTCEEVNTGYKCTCIDHYSGKNCQVQPPCEAKKPCKNGVCEDISDVDYKCKCAPMWTGKNCDERPCDKRPCVNFKQCINEANGFKCVCLPGWTGQKCDKEGPANGDPHYVTFDGKRYDFMGKCEYVYAKDCSKEHAFEVLQQNERCGGGTVSCTRSIRVLFQDKEVKLERRGVVYVDGVRVKSFPWTQTGSTTKITKYQGGAVLDVPDLLFSVRWDGYMGIKVEINQRYEGNMCGLMGNADGKPENDYQLPDKSITENIATFGNSWRKNPRCVNGIVPPDPCKQLTQAKQDAITEKCGKMKQTPFKQCNDRITPDVRYIPNCEYDLCAMKQNPSAAWCQALETYDQSCTSKGVNIDWEGKAEFKECGDPCAEMPCFNGAKCENSGRKDFKCICPTGFSGPTCKNVECKSGFVARGSVCYKKMTKNTWGDAVCPEGDKFMCPENEDENKFIYDTFVKSSRRSFWMNARVCGSGKLCAQNFGAVLYHNFDGQFPASGCVQMRYGKNGVWIVKNCGISSFFICKYRK